MVIEKTVPPSVQTLIMAGGRGERLYPLTAFRPKPAIPFGGVFRIIDFTLSNCFNSGLSHVSLLTQYRHKKLQNYIQRIWNGLWTETKREPLVCLPPSGGNQYRGTADAVFQNIGGLRGRRPEIVLILSADHVYRMDYRELLRYHAETDADLTIATVEHPLADAQHFGVVEVDADHRVVGFHEKPTNPGSLPFRPLKALISMGVYAFKREVLMAALLENSGTNGYDFGHHIIPFLVRSAHIRAHDFRDKAKDLPGYWRDIGTIGSYYEANMDLVRPESPFDPCTNDDWPAYPVCYRSSSPVCSLDSGVRSGLLCQSLMARLRTNCSVTSSVLSPGVRIEGGGLIEDSVLMPHVSIGRDARIRRAIIEEGVHIPARSQIGFDLENDRKNYFVTGDGVVVVTQTPKQTQFSVIDLPRRIGRVKTSSVS